MKLMNKLRRKKEETVKVGQTKVVTDLDRLFGNDKETVDALMHTMFLDPRKVGMKSKDAAENAARFEKAKNTLMANTWYEIAGSLAIYEGDVEKVVEYFEKCQGLMPISEYTVLKNPEKMVAKAQEYYKQTLHS
jgi:hypothetical protein